MGDRTDPPVRGVVDFGRPVGRKGLVAHRVGAPIPPSALIRPGALRAELPLGSKLGDFVEVAVPTDFALVSGETVRVEKLVNDVAELVTLQ